jgi:hypothetical protein
VHALLCAYLATCLPACLSLSLPTCFRITLPVGLPVCRPGGPYLLAFVHACVDLPYSPPLFFSLNLPTPQALVTDEVSVQELAAPLMLPTLLTAFAGFIVGTITGGVFAGQVNARNLHQMPLLPSSLPYHQLHPNANAVMHPFSPCPHSEVALKLLLLSTPNRP